MQNPVVLNSILWMDPRCLIWDFPDSVVSSWIPEIPIRKGEYRPYGILEIHRDFLSIQPMETEPIQMLPGSTGNGGDTVFYDGVVPGAAYVWALEANGSTAAEQILPAGEGNYTLTVAQGKAYDFKAFIDGTGNGYPNNGEVWKHFLDWNQTLGGFNLTPCGWQPIRD